MAPITQIRRAPDGSHLSVHSSGAEIALSGPALRRNCPCASCAEERGELNHSAPLAAPPSRASLLRVVKSTAQEQGTIEKVWPIGNYAVGIRFADGHDSGIYSFQLLSELCQRQISGSENRESTP